jgi:vitamin B12 transporter
MRHWFFRTLVLTLFLSAVSPLMAQQPPRIFEGVLTVTATGSESPVNDVPLPVTVVERDEIDDSQEESVADLLRRIPGVTVMRTSDEGSAMSLFVRGTESDHTLALFDGVRLNSPYFAGYDWSQLPTAGLERIEVVRGPYSALWGADAIGGAVNVIPGRASDGWSLSLFGEGGDDGWRRLQGTVGWAGSGFDLYASGFDRHGEGTLDNSDFASSQLLVNAGWSWAEGSRVSVLVQDLSSDIGVPFANPVTLTPSRRQRADQRLYAVPVRVQLNPGWQLELVGSLTERELSYRDPDDPFGFTSSDTLADTQQARLASRHQLGGHELTWGGEWRSDEVTDTSSYGPNLDGDTTSVTSLFVQDTWRASDSLRVVAGIRWDDADEWDAEFSPRIFVGWSVSPAVELRAGYGHGFRQPSVGELYFPFSGNPELEPERSDSFELGMNWFAGSSRIQANLFQTSLENLIEYSFLTFSFANVAEAEIRGAELAWDVPLSGRLVSSLQATWLDTEDDEGLPLLRRPEWSASWTLHGVLWGRLRGDLTVLWVGERADVDPITFGRTELEGHVTGNLALSYELYRGLEVTFRAQNLADEEYEEVAGYPAPGRRLMAGLRLGL